MAIFPLARYAELLEDVLKENNFRNVTMIKEYLGGEFWIFCYDSKQNEYTTTIRWNLPRFTAEIKTPKEHPRFKDLEKCIKKAYSREACIDVIINGKIYSKR